MIALSTSPNSFVIVAGSRFKAVFEAVLRGKVEEEEEEEAASGLVDVVAIVRIESSSKLSAFAQSLLLLVRKGR